MFIGIDPGQKGGIAGLDLANNILWAIEMPVKKTPKGKIEYDIPRIAALLRASQPTHVYLEHVHSMPKQGVSSTFLFGTGFGILLGIIGTLDLSMSLIVPRTWKAKLAITADKETSRNKASELFPACESFWKLKKHDGLAEAALLAYYGSGLVDLDMIDPGDIWELYHIEVNKNERAAKNSGRHHNTASSPKNRNARKRADQRLRPSAS
jgi:crossover junction endodeoxyribonuclease RuvC